MAMLASPRRAAATRRSAASKGAQLALAALTLLAAVKGMVTWSSSSGSSHPRRKVLNAAEELSSGDAMQAPLKRTHVFYVGPAMLAAQHSADGNSSASAPTAQAAVAPPAPGPPGARKYHVVSTAGHGAYMAWQSRVSYLWFLKAREACEAELGPGCPMGGYTRLLHSGKADDWMAEIPTVIMPPAPAKYEKILQRFPVLHRSFALKDWLETHSVPEEYVWMAEPDHIFLRAPPLWATPDRPAAFPFTYMAARPKEEWVRRLNPKNVSIDELQPIGNSPVQIHKEQLRRLLTPWRDLTVAIKLDPELDSGLGSWLSDMWSYAIASATLEPPIHYELRPEMQLHPPYSRYLAADGGRPAYMIHFTYGQLCHVPGAVPGGGVWNNGSAPAAARWRFDKRDYMTKFPTPGYPMPPKGCEHEVVEELIRRMNTAANILPRWHELAGPLPKEMQLQA